jgi:hypothetical protein
MRARKTAPTMNSPPQPFYLFKRPALELDSAIALPAWIAPSLWSAFRTRELEAFERANNTVDRRVRRSKADRAEPVRDRNGRPAERAREGTERLLDHELGPHLRELAAGRRVLGRVVDADDDGVAALPERPKRRE